MPQHLPHQARQPPPRIKNLRMIQLLAPHNLQHPILAIPFLSPIPSTFLTTAKSLSSQIPSHALRIHNQIPPTEES